MQDILSQVALTESSEGSSTLQLGSQLPDDGVYGETSDFPGPKSIVALLHVS